MLFPRFVHGCEVYNASQSELSNKMAEIYAENYKLIRFAGTDNHTAKRKTLGGMQADSPICDECDFAAKVKGGEITPFAKTLI